MTLSRLKEVIHTVMKVNATTILNNISLSNKTAHRRMDEVQNTLLIDTLYKKWLEYETRKILQHQFKFLFLCD